MRPDQLCWPGVLLCEGSQKRNQDGQPLPWPRTGDITPVEPGKTRSPFLREDVGTGLGGTRARSEPSLTQSRDQGAPDRQAALDCVPIPVRTTIQAMSIGRPMLGSGHLLPHSCGRRRALPTRTETPDQPGRCPAAREGGKWTDSLVSCPRKVRWPWAGGGLPGHTAWGAPCAGMPVGEELMSDCVCGGHMTESPSPVPLV